MLKKTKSLSELQISKYNFWTELNNYFDENSPLLNNGRKVSYEYWYAIRLNSKNYHLEIHLLNSLNKIRVLWVGQDINKKDYDKLYNNKNEIEQKLSRFGNVEWDRKNYAIDAWVSIYIPNFSAYDTSNWNDLFHGIEKSVKEFQKIVIEYLQ